MSNLIIVAASVLIQAAFGTLTWSTEFTAVIDTCMTDNGASVMYRCTDDSIWKYVYPDSTVCMGVIDSPTLYGGCDSSNNYIYRVENCTTAQANAKVGNCKYIVMNSGSDLTAYALDICYNAALNGNQKSIYYTCLGGVPYKYTYNVADCASQTPNTNTSQSSYTYNCGGTSDCHADAKRYSKGSDICNYDESSFDPPSASSCNYIVMDNTPYATGTCFSSRQGNYKYSGKYECDPDDNNKVMYYQWLDNDDCSGTTSKYLVSNYTSANYTIHCTGSTCGTVVRTYSHCLGTHRPSYDEVAYAFDQCIKYNDDPTVDNYLDTPYLDQYYMHSCIDGYAGIYYFLDSACTKINTFTFTNTSGNDCPTVVNGCSSDANQNFNMVHFMFITFTVSMIKFLF